MRALVRHILSGEPPVDGLRPDHELRHQLDATCTTIRALLEPAPFALALVDRDLRLEVVGPRLAEITGATPGDHHGRHLAHVIPGGEAIAALAAEVLDTGVARLDQERTLSSEVRLRVSCYPIRARDEIVGVGCLIEHASRRREAEGLVMQVPVPIAVYEGADHRLRFANPAWRALLGGTAALGARYRDIARTADDDPVLLRLDEVLKSGAGAEISEVPFRAAHEAGSIDGFYSAVLQPVHDAAGAVTGVIMAYADVSAPVRARRFLGEVVQTLLWSGPVGTDADLYGRQWSDYTGLSSAASLDGGWQQVVHPDDLTTCRAAAAAAADERAIRDCEARLRGASGAYRWHRVRFAFPRDASEGERWYGVACDIDDVRRRDDELAATVERERSARNDAERANRLKDRFLAAVSHELRGPLATLLLWEKALREDPSDAALRGRALDAFRQSAETLSRLVEDLLDVSRAISGKLHLDQRPVDVAAVIVAAVEAARPAAAARGLTVELQVAPGLGEVVGDLYRLRQVFDNLLSNALKFTPAGGLVRVTAHRRAAAVEVVVEDTGRGIRPDFVPRVFEPFSQDEEPLTRAHGGLGLGLAIARQLVDLHGGSITAASEGPGQGATFTLTLPPMAAGGSDAAASARAAPPRLDGLRLLVVDDDRNVLSALEALLGDLGATVECAGSAASAWQALAHSAPDVLISDLAMPGEDGYALIGRVREHGKPRIRGVPAIALTAHASADDRARVIAAGFDAHVAKPIDFEAFLRTIARLARRERDVKIT